MNVQVHYQGGPIAGLTTEIPGFMFTDYYGLGD
jgi:hypothetical protein